MTDYKKNPQGEISARRPGLVEGLADALLGASVRQLNRATGASERDAHRRASDVMQNFETLTGLQSAERSVRNVATGRGSPGDYVTTGLMALPLVSRNPLVRRAVGAADEALLGQRTRNGISPKPNPAATPTIEDRRPLISADQVTHGSRNISRAELEDVLKLGRFEVPTGGTRFNPTGKKDKWWSAADNEGIFGRPWNRANSYTVRLPVNKIPANRAASIRHAEIYDSATRSWIPVREFGKKYSIGGVVIDDGNPAKQRKLI